MRFRSQYDKPYYPSSMVGRRLYSNKQPDRTDLIMWDPVTDKEKTIYRALTDKAWDLKVSALMSNRGGRVFYSGRSAIKRVR